LDVRYEDSDDKEKPLHSDVRDEDPNDKGKLLHLDSHEQRKWIYIGVLSGPRNVQRRNEVRKSWLTSLRADRTDIMAKFIIGREPMEGVTDVSDRRQGVVASARDRETERVLTEEEEINKNDILRLPFADTYAELPAKTLALFSHAVQQGYEFIVKMDDDRIADVPRMDQFFSSLSGSQLIYAGCLLLERGESMDIQVGADGTFTEYFTGPTYALSRTLANEIAGEEGLAHSVAYNAYGSSSEDVDMGKWVQWVNSKRITNNMEPVRYYRASLSLHLEEAARIDDSFDGGLYRFTWPSMFIGNALFKYWNGRAIAELTGQDFVVDADSLKSFEQLNLTDALSLIPLFPKSVKPNLSIAKPYPDKERLDLRRSEWPAREPSAPWHLILDTILKDTVAVVNQLPPVLAPDAQPSGGVASSASGSYAVVHIRCDTYTLDKHTDYGLVPHRFVGDNLPSHIEKVYLVGENSTFDTANVCGQSAQDLQDYLREQKGVDVRPVSRDSRSDWLFLARAPFLFCMPSTFCASAALGNPNSVWMAVEGISTSVVAASESLQQVMSSMKSKREAQLKFVEIDYIPAVRAASLSWREMRRYLRSTSCKESYCLPPDRMSDDLPPTPPRRSWAVWVAIIAMPVAGACVVFAIHMHISKPPMCK